jgi:hypothetical protein
MPLHPLDGARLKVVRAQEHLKSLYDEIERYINTKPYDVPVKREGDFVSAEGAITAEPPARLSCLVGDCVTNLRAALDYVAWELVVKSGKSLRPKEKQRVAFPIFPNEPDFSKSDSTQFLKTLITANAFDVIKDVQPFNAGHEALGTLNDLVRVDKHRTLVICNGIFDFMPRIELHQGGSLLCWGYGRGIGVKLDASRELASEKGPVYVKVEGEGTIFVTFKDVPVPGMPVLETLAEIVKCVANVVPRFEPFFP